LQQAPGSAAAVDALMDVFIAGASDQQLHHTTLGLGALLATQLQAMLADAAAWVPAAQASGMAAAPVLAAVLQVGRLGVCGNGVCEVGERALQLAGGHGQALQPAVAPCPQVSGSWCARLHAGRGARRPAPTLQRVLHTPVCARHHRTAQALCCCAQALWGQSGSHLQSVVAMAAACARKAPVTALLGEHAQLVPATGSCAHSHALHVQHARMHVCCPMGARRRYTGAACEACLAGFAPHSRRCVPQYIAGFSTFDGTGTRRLSAVAVALVVIGSVLAALCVPATAHTAWCWLVHGTRPKLPAAAARLERLVACCLPGWLAPARVPMPAASSKRLLGDEGVELSAARGDPAVADGAAGRRAWREVRAGSMQVGDAVGGHACGRAHNLCLLPAACCLLCSQQLRQRQSLTRTWDGALSSVQLLARWSVACCGLRRGVS
jgi:hypothetical protein